MIETDFFESHALINSLHRSPLDFERNCLARLVKLFDTIVNFLENLDKNNFAKEIKLHKCSIFYLVWISLK